MQEKTRNKKQKKKTENRNRSSFLTNRVPGIISQLTGEISCRLNRSIIGYTNLESTMKLDNLVL